MSRRDMTWGWCHEGWCRHKARSRRHTGAPKRISDPVWCISWIQSDIYLGSNLMDQVLDPIRHTSHSSLSYSTISAHTHTQQRGGFEWSSDVKLRAAVASLWWDPLLSDPLWWDPLCLDPSHPPPLAEKAQVHWERLWGEYPPSFYQQIFLSCQCYLFWGGRCTSCMMMIASCSDCHHTVVTWPSSIYIGFQCPLIRSSLLLLL